MSRMKFKCDILYREELLFGDLQGRGVVGQGHWLSYCSSAGYNYPTIEAQNVNTVTRAHVLDISDAYDSSRRREVRGFEDRRSIHWTAQNNSHVMTTKVENKLLFEDHGLLLSV